MARSGDKRRWKDQLPPERAYKRRATSVAPAVEQDRAAGGRDRRWVDIGEGRFARASITLRLYRRTRRIRAYLRWSQDGKTRERYVCEVGGDSRKNNLAEAWECARTKGFVVALPLPAGSKATSAAVRAVMRANRGRDTGPELALRRMLHNRGLRYRVNTKPLPEVRRRADVVFPRARVAVFIDGCFWHGCRDHYRPATKNAEFWREKIESNQARDTETNMRLEAAGWTVIRIWEHDDFEQAAERVDQLVRRIRSDGMSADISM